MSSKQPNRGGIKQSGSSSCLTSVFLFSAGALTAFLLVWMFESANSDFKQLVSERGFGLASESAVKTFYDDSELGYMIEDPVWDWDYKRQVWLKQHPMFRSVSEDKMVIVTGSQTLPCKNPVGDHLLLRSFKNKVDYCRIHGCDVFYNNLLLHPKMFDCWAKLPAVRAAMLAHPEAEWIMWVDVDAFFTDMEFKFPFDRYKDYNFVVEGWNTYERRSYLSLNAGVFLIRNCQWSMEFIDEWASQGPQSPSYFKWAKIQKSLFKDKGSYPESDDQSALLYLMLEERAKWGDKIFLEEELSFQSHWVGVIEQLHNFSKAELQQGRKQRKHAEKDPAGYDYALRLEKRGYNQRPIMMHFAGCQPCSGKHNPAYSAQSCWDGMNQAITFADNQVLRNFGFVHPNIRNTSWVSPLTDLL